MASNIPLRCFHLLWNFVIRCDNYRILSLGVAYVLCAPLATALRFQWGWYVHTVGFTVPWVFTRSVGFTHGCDPSHLRRSSWLFCADRTWGRRDVVCNVFLPIMRSVSLSIMVFLPSDNVMLGMET